LSRKVDECKPLMNEQRETYREQVQSVTADGIDPENIGLQMAKLHELEGRLVEERGDKARGLLTTTTKPTLNRR